MDPLAVSTMGRNSYRIGCDDWNQRALFNMEMFGLRGADAIYRVYCTSLFICAAVSATMGLMTEPGSLLASSVRLRKIQVIIPSDITITRTCIPLLSYIDHSRNNE